MNDKQTVFLKQQASMTVSLWQTQTHGAYIKWENVTA